MRPLVKGERVRLTPGGQLCEVMRVSACAAYVQAIFDPPAFRVFEDPRTGEEKRIKVSRGPIQAGISPCAFVYRDEEAKVAAGEERYAREVMGDDFPS